MLTHQSPPNVVLNNLLRSHVVLYTQSTVIVTIKTTNLSILGCGYFEAFPNRHCLLIFIRVEMVDANDICETIIMCFIACLLPPLAIAIHEGCTKRVFIGTLLLFPFIIPAIIYALYILFE
ncbi:hypothetical protein GJ496_005927 [Pomphorhynchus laevis]|nr:hypothetical protein GJ496_005927 [Pomphorhynchus laevis]